MSRRYFASTAAVCAVSVLAWIVPTARAPAITIQRNFNMAGSPPGGTVGGGDLEDIFYAAADWWEMAIMDAAVIPIEFGWGTPGNSDFLAEANAAAGVPSSGGTIVFNNSHASATFFLDPTPHKNNEFDADPLASGNLGGGNVNTGRTFTAITGGPADGAVDLLSVVKHEIGHVLGIYNNAGNPKWDNPITVTAPRPLAGTQIATNNTNGGHIDVPSALMALSFNNNERRVQSAIDILAAAELNSWTNINLDPKTDFPTVAKWSQPFIPDEGENVPSDVDWRNIMHPPPAQIAPNWVVADDFVSDGRPITAVRWWGSYFDLADQAEFNPESGKYEAVVEEGFAISFHADAGAMPGSLLGTYVAGVDTVEISPTGLIGWDGHPIWEYEVDLDCTHAEHLIPGLSEENAFLERAGESYWLSIVAENGHELNPLTWQFDDNGDPVPTEHFWGWHTTQLAPLGGLDDPVMGRLDMPTGDWDYNNWGPLVLNHFGTQMAFELLTPVPEPGGMALVLVGAIAIGAGACRRRA